MVNPSHMLVNMKYILRDSGAWLPCIDTPGPHTMSPNSTHILWQSRYRFPKIQRMQHGYQILWKPEGYDVWTSWIYSGVLLHPDVHSCCRRRTLRLGCYSSSEPCPKLTLEARVAGDLLSCKSSGQRFAAPEPKWLRSAQWAKAKSLRTRTERERKQLTL